MFALKRMEGGKNPCKMDEKKFLKKKSIAALSGDGGGTKREKKMNLLEAIPIVGLSLSVLQLFFFFLFYFSGGGEKIRETKGQGCGNIRKQKRGWVNTKKKKRMDAHNGATAIFLKKKKIFFFSLLFLKNYWCRHPMEVHCF